MCLTSPCLLETAQLRLYVITESDHTNALELNLTAIDKKNLYLRSPANIFDVIFEITSPDHTDAPVVVWVKMQREVIRGYKQKLNNYRQSKRKTN